MRRLTAWLHGAWTAARTLGPRGVVERQRRRLRDRRDYARWLRAEAGRAPCPAATFEGGGPLISVLMPTFETDPRWLERAVASVRGQSYRNWELCIADDASGSSQLRSRLGELERADPRVRVALRARRGHISAASNTALSLARGEFVALLDHDDELAPDALLQAAAALRSRASLEVLYSDEDKIDHRGRRVDAYFKPDWSPDLLLSQNFISHLGVYRAELVRRVGGFREGYEGAQDHDLVLRVMERSGPDRIHHIPRVLYHWRTSGESTSGGLWRKGYAFDAGSRAIEDHLARTGRPADVERTSYAFYRVRYRLPEPAPSVTVVAVGPVVPGMGGALESTAGEGHPEVRRADPGGRDGPAAAINAAIRGSRGEVVVLLGPGCRPREGWLDELVSQAVRPEVGVVGGKVVSTRGRVLHAGYLLCLNRDPPVLNAHRGIPQGARGYFGRANLVQNMLAVSGDCMAFRRETFEALGGLDSSAFPGAHFDVDFCLRGRAAGLRTVLTPYAVVVQTRTARGGHEAGEAAGAGAGEALRDRWSTSVPRDPYWHPELDPTSPDFRLRV